MIDPFNPPPRPAALFCHWTTTREPDGTWKHVSKCAPNEFRITPAEFPTLTRECAEGRCYAEIPDDHPSMVSKLFSVTTATLKWIRAGRPTRTPEEVAAAFKLCQACPKFIPTAEDRSKGTCKLCGCGLASIGGMANKISMATEHCPLKNPKW
jgi:hypothetical protein